MKSLLSAAAIAALGPAVSGCAFVTVHIDPPAPSELATGGGVGRGRLVVVEVPMGDARPDARRCGTQKNGYDMETADVVCTTPAPQWMAEALATGLKAAGFRVYTRSDGLPATTPRVHGEVAQLFLEPVVGVLWGTLEADVAVNLEVTSPTGLRATRRFYVKRGVTALIWTEDVFQGVSTQATQEAVAKMVSAVAELLDRYPELGEPPRLAANDVRSAP